MAPNKAPRCGMPRRLRLRASIRVIFIASIFGRDEANINYSLPPGITSIIAIS